MLLIVNNSIIVLGLGGIIIYTVVLVNTIVIAVAVLDIVRRLFLYVGLRFQIQRGIQRVVDELIGLICLDTCRQ
jgi:hypothetical protein